MIWGIIQSLGLGEQLVAALALFVLAWYCLRAVSLAGTIGVAISSGIMYVVVTAVALGVALALGWLDPQVGAINDTISGARSVVENAVVDWVTDQLGEVA